jgi:ferrous iron transport protein B
VGDAEEETIKNRMAAERFPDGSPVFTLASGLSLMVFYAFAMQCMSTLAIVRKETNSWRWPSIQLVVMTAVAYLGALLTFQYFSA